MTQVEWTVVGTFSPRMESAIKLDGVEIRLVDNKFIADVDDSITDDELESLHKQLQYYVRIFSGSFGTTVTLSYYNKIINSSRTVYFGPSVISLRSTGFNINNETELLSNELISFMEKTSAHLNNPKVNKMMSSYRNSFEEENVSLIRLYEIGEALESEFNGYKGASSKLGIRNADFGLLTRFACNENYFEGRHLGRYDNLRHINPSELEQVRKITREMILKYIIYIENNLSQG